MTASYHPYNSRANDYVRDQLLLRIQTILAENREAAEKSNDTASSVYVFNDISSNLSLSFPASTPTASGVSIYFEGTNIIVYIRGSEDDQSDWWKEGNGKPTGDGGVLVNAHYDSVSTGFGATDDGVGVVTVLQLIKYYTTPGNTPKRGLVALLNNGEEDFLNGAAVFSQHPMSRFAHTFLNLEGAGAGGRAMLFRSTDTEVTRAYEGSPHPFGTVIVGDGFARGLVRSQTDYVILNGILGLRGLDVAFFEPRARYHTDEDNARHTGKDSLWHMLSAALSTTKALTSDTSSKFEGEPATSRGVHAGTGSPGVWFDLFGSAFVVFQLHTLFALSVTLLVVTPIFHILTMIVLYRMDKFYPFSGSGHVHTSDGDEAVPLYGWRGFFRFPIIFALACAAPIALAYWLFEANPFIAHSSQWSVWSMMFASFMFVAWSLSCMADYIRPSSLTREYCFTWMISAWWAILVANTVFETQLQLAGGYFVLFYFAALSLARWISLFELFALPKKAKYCHSKVGSSQTGSRSSSQPPHNSRRRPSGGASDHDEQQETDENAGEDPTERTGLLAGRARQTFANYVRDGPDTDEAPTAEETTKEAKQGRQEQDWGHSLPRWTWLLQFLLTAPIIIIVTGQIGLLGISALHQTGQDGSSMLLVYMGMAVFTILILSPLVPFLHRFTWHIPTFLLLVLIGTLIYNLVAFPFSPNNRLKLFFQQEVDLDSGINNVSLVGVPPFVQEAISSLPSAAGQPITCVDIPPGGRRKCSWHGLPPKVVDPFSRFPPETQYRSWLAFNVSRSATANSARFMLFGPNTRACRLLFDNPISDFKVHGSSPPDKRFPLVPEGGSKEIRLWSRTWGTPWTVDVDWEGQGKHEGERVGMQGKVVCLWSDANREGVIPALDEVRHFAPAWVAVTKFGDGLVEGSKGFII